MTRKVVEGKERCAARRPREGPPDMGDVSFFEVEVEDGEGLSAIMAMLRLRGLSWCSSGDDGAGSVMVLGWWLGKDPR